VLIETAFLKLPELLLSNFDHGSEVESTIVHLLASALQMEMNGRNIPRPYAAILTQKPYEGVPPHRRPVRADLFVDLSAAVCLDSRMIAYGVRPKNWLEAKAPLATGRLSRPTLRAPLLVRDCLRVCLLPKELAGSSTATENGRYLLWVLDTDPRLSLSDDSWIRPVLEPGNHPLQIEADGLSIDANVRTLWFEPDTANAPSPLFWGYLVRIGRFSVSGDGRTFSLQDVQGTGFTSEVIADLETLRDIFLAREEEDSSKI